MTSALFLGAHQYDIEYKRTKLHSNVDGLLRLPLKLTESSDTVDPADVFHTMIVSQLPVTNVLIQKKTRNDPTLSKIYEITVKGWPKHGNSVYPTFSVRREQLSVCQGTLMCGLHVEIPSKLRRKMLNTLHEREMGNVKIKKKTGSQLHVVATDRQRDRGLNESLPWMSKNAKLPTTSYSSSLGMAYHTMARSPH